MLQNFPPSSLNQDEVKDPKQTNFGLINRGRISSQCLKRAIRENMRETLNDQKFGVRTCRMPEIIGDKLLKEGVSEDIVTILKSRLTGFGNAANTEKKPKNGEYLTSQTMFLTTEDFAHIINIIKELLKTHTTKEDVEKITAKDLESLCTQNGYRELNIDVALFGRMITSNVFKDVDSAVQVAHSITTNKVVLETDYFVAMDDSGMKKDDVGADMIGITKFLGTACYYKFICLNVKQLWNNLIGNDHPSRAITTTSIIKTESILNKTIKEFVKAAVVSIPSGKQNSFAALTFPSCVVMETHKSNGRVISYANAFESPVNIVEGEPISVTSEKRLKNHIDSMDRVYGNNGIKRYVLHTSEDVNWSNLEVEGLEDLIEKL